MSWVMMNVMIAAKSGRLAESRRLPRYEGMERMSMGMMEDLRSSGYESGWRP